jgi:hypothetical protein
VASTMMFLDHTQTKTIRTPLREGSVRRIDCCLTSHNTHDRDIYAPGGIRTRYPSRRAAVDPCFRPRGYRNRALSHILIEFNVIMKSTFTLLEQIDPVGESSNLNYDYEVFLSNECTIY